MIAITNSFETSVMATMLCKEAGVKEVIVKCSNDIHKKLLEKGGLNEKGLVSFFRVLYISSPVFIDI